MQIPPVSSSYSFPPDSGNLVQKMDEYLNKIQSFFPFDESKVPEMRHLFREVRSFLISHEQEILFACQVNGWPRDVLPNPSGELSDAINSIDNFLKKPSEASFIMINEGVWNLDYFLHNKNTGNPPPPFIPPQSE